MVKIVKLSKMHIQLLKWKCNICGETPTVNIDDKRYTSIRCRCRMHLIYPSGKIITIPKEAYNPTLKDKNI